MSPIYFRKLAASLTKDDWDYILQATQNRFYAAKPKAGEPPSSKEFKDMESRIISYLMARAYGGFHGPQEMG